MGEDLIMSGKNIFEYLGYEWSFDWGFSYGYDQTIQRLHPNIKWIFNMEDNWQGEWVSVGKNEEGYWYQQGSFGSCSGCDWVQSIDTIEKAKEFLDAMKKIAFIGKTKEDALCYLQKEAFNLDFVDFTQIIQQLEANII